MPNAWVMMHEAPVLGRHCLMLSRIDVTEQQQQHMGLVLLVNCGRVYQALCVPAGACSSPSCCCHQGDATGTPQAPHAGPAEQGSTKGLVGCYTAQDAGLYRLLVEAAAAAAELVLVCLEMLPGTVLGPGVAFGGHVNHSHQVSSNLMHSLLGRGGLILSSCSLCRGCLSPCFGLSDAL